MLPENKRIAYVLRKLQSVWIFLALLKRPLVRGSVMERMAGGGEAYKKETMYEAELRIRALACAIPISSSTVQA